MIEVLFFLPDVGVEVAVSALRTFRSPLLEDWNENWPRTFEDVRLPLFFSVSLELVALSVTPKALFLYFESLVEYFGSNSGSDEIVW